MSLEYIKITIQQEIEALFANAAVDKLTNDVNGYKQKLDTIAKVAEILGINIEVTIVTINLQD